MAIANEGGGKLLLGITDKPPRQIVGTQAFGNLGDIKKRIVDALKVRVEIDEIDHPDGRVLVFNIPTRPAAIALSYEGAYWMRAGESLMPMTHDQLRSIFAENKQDYLLNIAKDSLEASSIIELLDTPKFFELLKLPYPAERDAVLTRCVSEHLITSTARGYSITNLGALLFAKDLSQFDILRRKAVRVVVYKGIGKNSGVVRDQLEYKGYAANFEQLVAYILSQLPANDVINQALRSEVLMYPILAIRELVANALIHQDVEDGGSFVAIDIYQNRIEITNPGKPLIPADRFIDEYKSRNERLTDLMRRFGICEEQSSGIDKVVGLVELWQLPPPEFMATEHHTKVILFAHKEFLEMDRKERIRACYQHCCLSLVNQQKMTNQSLRERFKLPVNKSETISRIIAETAEEGLIKFDDPESNSRRYAKYVPYWS